MGVGSGPSVLTPLDPPMTFVFLIDSIFVVFDGQLFQQTICTSI